MKRKDEEMNEEIEYAGFWVRVIARLIDAVILMIPMLMVPLVFDFKDMDDITKAFYQGFFNLVIGASYYIFLTASESQATVGKKMMGLKVVDKNGNRISLGRSTGRYFAEILSALIFCIGYFMVGWTAKKQSLHDIIAETFVIKTTETL